MHTALVGKLQEAESASTVISVLHDIVGHQGKHCRNVASFGCIEPGHNEIANRWFVSFQTWFRLIEK